MVSIILNYQKNLFQTDPLPGNIVAGGLIGYAVDSTSGAGFDYPTMMNIPLQKQLD